MATPAWVTQLVTRRTEITTELAAIDNNATRAKPGAKPDANGEGSIANNQYKLSLYEELSKINALIADAEVVATAEDALASEQGPFEFETTVDS